MVGRLRHDFPSELEGVWWIPEFEMAPIGGRLRLEDSGTLTAYGALWPDGWERLYYDELPPVLGLCSGRKVTLLDPDFDGIHQVPSKTSRGYDVTRTILKSGTTLIGEHYPASTDALFASVRVDITGATQFASRPDFLRDSNSGFERVEFSSQPDLTAKLVDAEVLLRDGRVGSYSLYNLEWSRRQVFELRLAHPLSIDSIDKDYIRPLRYLLSLTSDKPARVVSLAANFERPRKDVDIYRIGYPYSYQPEQFEMPNQVIVGLRDRSFQQLVSRWFELAARLGPVMDLIFSTDEQMGYVENKFFDLASALEGFHEVEVPGKKSNRLPQDRHALVLELKEQVPEKDRAWFIDRLTSPSTTLTMEDKVQRVLDYCGPWIENYIGRTGAWRSRVAEFRNQFAHPTPGVDDIYSQTRLAGRLATNLRYITRIALIRSLGFSQDECQEVFARAFRWSDSFDSGPRTFPDVFQ